MGAYGVSVEKKLTFRGLDERFANIYHYVISAPVETDYTNLADAVVARDKAAYPSAVTYLTTRVYGPTEGSKADNLMRLVRDESGAGTKSVTGSVIYPELCYVTAIYVGRSPVKNRKVFVRKYIRCLQGYTGGTNASSGAVNSTDQGTVNSWMNANKTVTSGGVSFDMCTPKNQGVPALNQAFTLPWLHVRQIHQ